ncbi:hypothetical protein [Bremerella sp. P1]|uniref:hypothetical protein n=1 Tax=Bremerella sp. P1 TaxID=3026424 RepID=UPI002368A3DB|nr:hypothetical protein [Bremerella sp. P1]WDI43935.1 hypothetical protein PSR63_08305 [Bremerella sp. P1]
MNQNLWKLSLLAMFTLVAAGCGQGPGYPVGKVQGTLTLKGKPVTENVEVFLMNHQTGFAYKAAIGDGGAFEVEEPVRVGEYIAYLQPAVDMSLDMNGPPTPTSAISKIPKKYTNDVGSDLKVAVVEGDNEVMLDMK